ncbi:MAG: dTDP-4-dehydrorhamnose reductase [Clostridia bacterium]|nr:dTDP-4-dehydrorhamnose reductase [Clostridia bacterium]
MRVFVTGVNGQLGHDVVNELAARGHDVVASDITPAYAGLDDGTSVTTAKYIPADITDAASLDKIISSVMPDCVIHPAGWTAVDAAEDPENREKVFAVNAKGTENVALACRKAGCKMIYISTDYVFDGKGTEPRLPDDESFSPLGVYAESKLEGELAVKRILEKYFIVRIAWVFGINGKNFVKTMLSLGKTHPELRVVSDQIGTPTYTLDLAPLLCDMAQSEKYGVYHATNSGGFISWYDFACEIFRIAGYETKVVPVTTAEYGLSKAKRPFNSRLDKSKLDENGFSQLPDWRDALLRYIEELRAKEMI